MDEEAMDDEDSAEGAKKRNKHKLNKDTTSSTGTNKEEGDSDTDDDNKRPLTIQRIFRNCTAFMGVIFIITGELMNEHNLWAVVVIGGTLTILNVMLTSLRLESLQAEVAKKNGTTVQFADMMQQEQEQVVVETQRDSGRERRDSTKRKQGKRRKSQNGEKQKQSRGRAKSELPPDAIAINLDNIDDITTNDDESRQRGSGGDDNRRRGDKGGENDDGDERTGGKGVWRMASNWDRSDNMKQSSSRRVMRLREGREHERERVRERERERDRERGRDRERRRERERESSGVRQRGILKRGTSVGRVERRQAKVTKAGKEGEAEERGDRKSKRKRKKDSRTRLGRHSGSHGFIQV